MNLETKSAFEQIKKALMDVSFHRADDSGKEWGGLVNVSAMPEPSRRNTAGAATTSST